MNETRIIGAPERRNHERMPVALGVDLMAPRQVRPIQGVSQVTEDLSAGGLAVRCAYPLYTGDRVKAVMYLPARKRKRPVRREARRLRPVRVWAQVAWCRPAERGEFRGGLRILRIHSEHRRSFKFFLDAFYLDPENRWKPTRAASVKRRTRQTRRNGQYV